MPGAVGEPRPASGGRSSSRSWNRSGSRPGSCSSVYAVARHCTRTSWNPRPCAPSVPCCEWSAEAPGGAETEGRWSPSCPWALARPLPLLGPASLPCGSHQPPRRPRPRSRPGQCVTVPRSEWGSHPEGEPVPPVLVTVPAHSTCSLSQCRLTRSQTEVSWTPELMFLTLNLPLLENARHCHQRSGLRGRSGPRPEAAPCPHLPGCTPVLTKDSGTGMGSLSGVPARVLGTATGCGTSLGGDPPRWGPAPRSAAARGHRPSLC